MAAASDTYSLDAVKITKSGTVYLPVKSAEWDPGIELALIGAGSSAAYANSFGAGLKSWPRITLTFEDIYTAYSNIGDYMNIDTAAADEMGDVTLYFNKLVHGGFRDSTAGSAKTVTIGLGMALARNLRAQHNQIATMTYEIIPALTSGGAEGIIVDDADPLTSITTVTSATYDCGPMTCGGVTLGLSEFNMDWGFKEDVDPDSGLTRIEAVSILKWEPKATAKFLDVSALEHDGPVTEWGKNPGTDVVVYLRRMSATAASYRAGASSHISFTFKSGSFVHPTAVNGDWTGVADMGLEINPIFDGTNALMAVATNASIP